MAYVDNGGRDLRLDLLRGFAVLAMVIDHIGGQSPLYLLTGGDQFFTSAAEGFVTISGFLVGQVYRQMAVARGLGLALRRLLERAWLLYLVAVGLALVVLPAGRLIDLPWSSSTGIEDPRGELWGVFTLHQTAYLADVALLYALLLGIAPLVFLLLFERQPWLVLGASWGLWAAYQVNPSASELPWPITNNSVFHLSAWQVLFVSAMVLGFHAHDLRRKWNRAWDGPGLVLVGAGTAALVAVYATHPEARDLVTDPTCAWLAKNSVGVGRIAASAVVFAFAWLAVSRFWVPIRRAAGWLLLPLGQNTLWAYSGHVIVALVIGAAVAGLSPGTRATDMSSSPAALSTTVNAALQIGSIALLWLAIRMKVFRLAPGTRGTWMAAPAPVLLAATLLLWANPGRNQAVSSSTVAAPLASNPLGTPIPAQQAAAIARELGAASPASRSALRQAPAPAATPVPTPSASPQPTAPARVALPAFTPTVQAALPGQPWSGSAGPSGARLEGSLRQMHFHSQALDRDMPYLIYLPPGYATQSKRYPVVYLLHGAGQRVDEWLGYGVVEAADRMIVATQIQPMLLVMPLGDLGYWVNHVEQGDRWGDYVAADVVQHVDRTFRTEAEGKFRGIGGLSMGGYGALVLAFTHPDRFHLVAANSATLHPEGSLSILGTGDQYAHRDPVSLAASADGLGGLGIWLDMGVTDPWLPRLVELDQALNTRGVEHTWMLADGGHDGGYWQRNVPAYLRFYSNGFT